MSSSALPPPGNLPSWSRVSALDRSRYPKPFLRDRIPLPPGAGATISTDAVIDFNNSINSMDVKFLEEVSNSDQHRLICYNKSIKFLQQQHSETLMKLHEELDKLKKENKELQFKVVLSQSNNSSITDMFPENKKPSSAKDPARVETVVLKDEIRDLRRALKESNNRNAEMQKMLQSFQNHRESQSAKSYPPSAVGTLDGGEQTGNNDKVCHRRKFSISNLSSPLPLNATLNPLQVKDGAENSARVPSMSECELIIEQLHETNCQQLAELSRLRSSMKGVRVTRNSATEVQTVKTFELADESFSDTRLPRIPVKPITKKSIASANSSERIVALPALKNSISSNAADRRKRQQAVQKARSKKDFQ